MNEKQKTPGKMEKTTGDVSDSSGDRGSESVVVSANDDKSARDHFYEQLRKLNEPSGLSFVFNFRDTMLDLHCLYKEVIQRGGFYQVTKIGKWDDVASTLKLKNLVNISAAQLQSIYETLLLQYELMYSHETVKEANTWPEKTSLGSCSGVNLSSSTGKRKHCDNSFLSVVHSGDVGGMAELKIMCNNSTIVASTNSNVKGFVQMPDPPLKPRTGYQIFLRLETQRLKKIHGETSSSHNLREMAIQAWRCLTEKDKQPYAEASKMDKERYEREMAAYEQLKKNQNANIQSLVSNPVPTMLSFSKPTETDDVYHVCLEPNCDDLISPDESMIKLAFEVMKSAQSKNPMSQIDWDYGSLDLPYQMDDEGTFSAEGA